MRTTAELLSHYIGGEWVPGKTVIESLNPSDTRDIVARAPSDGRRVTGGDRLSIDKPGYYLAPCSSLTRSPTCA